VANCLTASRPVDDACHSRRLRPHRVERTPLGILVNTRHPESQTISSARRLCVVRRPIITIARSDSGVRGRESAQSARAKINPSGGCEWVSSHSGFAGTQHSAEGCRHGGRQPDGDENRAIGLWSVCSVQRADGDSVKCRSPLNRCDWLVSHAIAALGVEVSAIAVIAPQHEPRARDPEAGRAALMTPGRSSPPHRRNPVPGTISRTDPEWLSLRGACRMMMRPVSLAGNGHDPPAEVALRGCS
jgi:hypothetical protein